MNNKIFLYIFYVFLFISILTFSYLVFSQLPPKNISVSILLYSTGKLAGLIGFLFLSLLIISGDSARFFDRFFGIDKIIKFQRKFAMITTVFVIFHPLFFILSTGNYFIYLIPTFTFIPLSLGIISFYIFVVVMICSRLYKKISYQVWQYIHILTYILFFLSIYHAFNIGSDTKNFFVKIIFSFLFAGIIIGGIYRTYYKIKHKKFKYYVEEINFETKNVFTLKLKPNHKLNFKPGQFCFLRINKNKLYSRHPFTISSSPNEKTINFTMKITGGFTKTASQLKKGEEVIVDGPFGVFTITDDKKDLVFIAGGVGITPFMSMIKHNLYSNKKQNITLIYGARTKKDIIFKNTLDKIKEKWFKKVYVLSDEKSFSKNWKNGYIDTEIIKNNVDNLKNSLFYICGPEPMKENITKILKDLGVKKSNIKIESFFW